MIIILVVVVITLFVLYKKRVNVSDSAPFQSSDVSKDTENEGKVVQIAGSLFQIKLSSGEIKDYLLTNKVIYICMQKDEDYYIYLKENDRENLDIKYLIDKEEVPNIINIGNEIELFLYEYTPNKVFIKAIVDKDC